MRIAEDGIVNIRQFAGEGTDFLEGIQVRWDDTPEERGPTGTAIRTGEIQFSRLDSDPDFMPWRARAVGEGFKFAVAMPLVAHERVLGALTLFTRPGVLDESGVEALQGFADQVAISVYSAQTVEQLELQRVALESAANAVVVTDRAGIIRWVNPGVHEAHGMGGAGGSRKDSAHSEVG
jgi:GAF domain-containing protein